MSPRIEKQFCGHGNNRNWGPCKECAAVDAKLGVQLPDDDSVDDGKRGSLRWDPTDGSPGRWQCGDHGIHAGDAMEIELAPGRWVSCRIESTDSGRKLIACFGVEQLLDKEARPSESFDSGLSLLSAKINPNTANLRWPSRSRRS